MKGRPDCGSSGRSRRRRTRYSSRRRLTSRRHSGSGSVSWRLAPTATGCGTTLSSATRGPSQNEQVSVSSSSKAPHFEHICITGPFCAAEVPVRNGRDGNTIAFAQTTAVASSRKCRVSGNPHPAPYLSSCAPGLGYFAQIFTTGATGATRYRPDCDHSGRVLG